MTSARTVVTPTWRGRVIAFLIGILLLGAISETLLRIVMPHWRDFYSGRFMTRTIVPGYGAVTIGRQGFDGYFAQNNGDFRAHIRLNELGLRNVEPVHSADGRVWIIGDSMTFGWGVDGSDMYSTIAGQLAGAPTYNVASPGTDVCGYQALLARMPRNLRPRAVVVGLVLENDVHPYDCSVKARAQEQAGITGDRIHDANLQGLKTLLTENSALYNFFAVGLKRVDLANQILITTGLLRQPHVPQHELRAADITDMTRRTAAELERLKTMLAPGTPMAVLLMPTRFEVRDGDPVQRDLRLAMSTALGALGIEAIDLWPGFSAAGFEVTHLRHDGHWNASGHRIAGEAVAAWLRRDAAANP